MSDEWACAARCSRGSSRKGASPCAARTSFMAVRRGGEPAATPGETNMIVMTIAAKTAATCQRIGGRLTDFPDDASPASPRSPSGLRQDDPDEDDRAAGELDGPERLIEPGERDYRRHDRLEHRNDPDPCGRDVPERSDN